MGGWQAFWVGTDTQHTCLLQVRVKKETVARMGHWRKQNRYQGLLEQHALELSARS